MSTRFIRLRMSGGGKALCTRLSWVCLLSAVPVPLKPLKLLTVSPSEYKFPMV